MIIVPNEWLVDLLLGSVREQRLVHFFLDRVDSQGHILALRRQGRLTQKLKRAVRDPQKRVKRLWLLVWDLDKITWVEEDEIIALPEELQRDVRDDDRYLVETAFAKRPCLLVTTDEPLLEILRRQQEFQVQLLDDFLRLTC